MSDPVQITARGARVEAERAAAALDADLRLEGVAYAMLEEDETRGAWRLEIFPGSDEEAQAILGLLTVCGDLKVTSAPLSDADWLAMALSGLPPVRAGRFFVYGAHDRGRVPANAVSLRIEAGAAFGTGHHGTTLGCLAALDRLLKRRRFDRVLDVGTGTGILAIAAARTGARIAVGADIDPVSVRIARENAQINGVNGARTRFVRADGLAASAVAARAPYDLVFANILAGPLIRLAPDIRDALRVGGVAILSGLLRGQARAVAAAYLDRGFRLGRRDVRDAWVTLTLVRR